MTQEEFTNGLPWLTNNSVPITSPFVFRGMSARIFPLRASLNALQSVCDGYMNFIPPEAGRFRVPAPYVYLMVLDYSQIAETVARVGWFAQIEIFFSVPVEWYKLVNGQWVFHDWGVITPYIFVNDSFSVPLGRQVFGFNKVLAKVVTSKSEWITNPFAPVSLITMETTVFPEAYAGAALQSKVFLEVERDAPASNLNVPFGSSGALTPWGIASNFAAAAAGFSHDALEMAQALRILPLTPAPAVPPILQAMFARMGQSALPWGEGFVQNSFNLKQFRRSEAPDLICYQALTNGRMITSAFNGGGLLGEDRTLMGDLSGGHTVRLYEHSSLPIVRTLGLEVAESFHNGDVEVAELKPVMPFWIDVDITYEQGTNVAWRADDGIWKDETGAPFPAADQPDEQSDEPEFNCTIPSAIEAITGPFQFSDTTIRVLPLLADKKTLQGFLDTYLNAPLEDAMVREEDGAEEHVRFEVWSRPPQAVNAGIPIGGDAAYVYLTALSFGNVTSETDNVGDWAKYELSFGIPVKLMRKRPEGWICVDAGVVPAFTFVDECIAAITRMEVQGIQASTANFVRPESVWLSAEGELSANPVQTLLRVDSEVWPALNQGQKAIMRPVVEIGQGLNNAGLGHDPGRPWRWSEELRLELGTKKGAKVQFASDLKIARTMALELLGNRTPFSLYTLKQIRDSTDPDRACYQSLVRVPRSLTEVFDVREIEETLAVRIYDFPSLDIVHNLGIIAAQLDDSTSGIIHVAQAVRPFYIRGTVDEPLAERLCSRAGTKQWTIPRKSPLFRTLLSDESDSPHFTVDLKAERLQDMMDPSRTAENVFQAANRLVAGDQSGSISAEQARNALVHIDAQMVIESVLSREWSNCDPNARWRKGRAALLDALGSLPEGGDAKPWAEAELYRQTNNSVAIRPGAVASRISVDELQAALDAEGEHDTSPPVDSTIAQRADGTAGFAQVKWRQTILKIVGNQYLFTKERLAMERSSNPLSSVAVLGVKGFQEACARAGIKALSVEELREESDSLRRLLAIIQKMSVEGEPSPHNNLDPASLAVDSRLQTLLGLMNEEFDDESPPGSTPLEEVETGRAHAQQFREAVKLARDYSKVQYEALLNKLSRAFQKPDFCIRRDAVGAQRDRLLPLTSSWDEEWYYGGDVNLPGHILQTPPPGSETI